MRANETGGETENRFRRSAKTELTAHGDDGRRVEPFRMSGNVKRRNTDGLPGARRVLWGHWQSDITSAISKITVTGKYREQLVAGERDAVPMENEKEIETEADRTRTG